MKNKRVVIDLTDYGHTTCGFGQIASNYATLFAQAKRDGLIDFDLVYLLPKKLKGKKSFDGVECYYVCHKWMNKAFPFTLPKADVWHMVHQQCKLYRGGKNTKMIFTIHDLNYLTEKPACKHPRYNCKIQRRTNRASVVTAISEFTAQRVREHIDLKGKPLRVIYNGVECLPEPKSERPAFVKADRPFFFAIGQYRAKKNFHLLIEMMKHFPDYELYICGERSGGPYPGKIEAAANQTTNVHVTGPISNEDRVWLYNNCAAYLFPSVGEGFGLPMIEAMQCGKPVFISNATCLPEISQGHAFIWPSLVPDEMATVVREGLATFEQNPQLAEEEKVYSSQFCYAKHIEAYLNLYRELLKD